MSGPSDAVNAIDAKEKSKSVKNHHKAQPKKWNLKRKWGPKPLSLALSFAGIRPYYRPAHPSKAYDASGPSFQ
jgi:hypothetical protein